MSKLSPDETSVGVLFTSNIGGVLSTVKTVKFDDVVTVTPLTVTEIGPVVASFGTLVVIMVGLAAITKAFYH